MSAKTETKPTPEELWERAGYARAAADAVVGFYDALDDAPAADAVLAAYARGKARWKAEHPEAHE
jgi:hypothetical protein